LLFKNLPGNGHLQAIQHVEFNVALHLNLLPQNPEERFGDVAIV
jgi:hypothetical protein